MTIILDNINILIENTYFFINYFFEKKDNKEIEIVNIIKGDDL